MDLGTDGCSVRVLRALPGRMSDTGDRVEQRIRIECARCERPAHAGVLHLGDRNRIMTQPQTQPIVPTVGTRSRASEDANALGERLGARIRGLLKRSLHVRHLDAGSCNGCDWEIQALLGPVYDIQRLGIDIVASPRHADLLLVTGSVTRNLEQAALATYEAMPRPSLVVAVGACACGGG